MAKRELILVVDDNPHIVKLIQVNLEFEGYKTIGAYNGKEALLKIRENKPNLVILDILMPSVDGWHVLEELKHDPSTVNIPIIVLSAMGTKEDRRRGLELGVTDYVTKPFNAMRLLEVVDRILHPVPTAPPPPPVEVPNTTRVAIIGASERAMGILQTLLGNSRVEILGLSTADDQAPAAKLAKKLKIYTTDNPYSLCRLPNVDLLIETEPHSLDLELVQQLNPRLEVLRGYSTAFAWSLVEEREASEERARTLVQELHAKVKELNALYEAGKMLGSVMELGPILRFVLDLMGDSANAESGVLLMEDDGKFFPRTTRGNITIPPSLPKAMAPMAFQTGKPVILTKSLKELDSPQTVLIPLVTKKKNLGFVALFFRQKRALSESDLTFLATLATQAAIAIENAKLYEDATQSKKQIEALLSKVIYAQEEERKRIAAEIHDSIAQSLVSALTKVQTCQALFGKPGKGAEIELEALKKHLVENVQEVRQIIFNLRPSTLDDLGLIPTLQHFLKKFEAENSIRTFLSAEMPKKKLPAVVETAVYRIVQEALTNVKKHSRATKVDIEVKSTNGKLLLRISDNGTGFSLEEARNKGLEGDSVGITGMKERVTLLGGLFKIESSGGQGSQVFIEVPIH